MGADAIVTIVLYSVAAGCALLGTCASPKHQEEPAVVGTVQEETTYYYPEQQQTSQVTYQNNQQQTAQAVSQPVSQPAAQQQTKQAPTTVSTKILVPTGVQTNQQTNQQTASKETTPEKPKEQMHEAFIKRYLKAYYTGDSSFVVSKNVEDLEKDQDVKGLMIQDVEAAKKEADSHGGFQEVKIKNVSQSGEDYEFSVDVVFKDNSVAEQHKFKVKQVNKIWKAY